MKSTLEHTEKQGKPSPLRGEGGGGGDLWDYFSASGWEKVGFLPLTLTLSPKGRGEMTFDNTGFVGER